MIVELIASTVVTGWGKMRDAGWVDRSYNDVPPITGDNVFTDLDDLAEFAGRLCYQSWDRPNPATATNEGYLQNILKQQHYSVLEHASATFYVAGVSRSLSHELVRHRHLSFSQVSQRYVDSKNVEFIEPPAITAAQLMWGPEGAYPLGHLAADIRDTYRTLADRLEASGSTRKQAREAARFILPNATETKFVVTGNMRAWRDVIAKRISPHADAEMQHLAKKILNQLKEIAPNTFQDM